MAAATWAYTRKRPAESPLTNEAGEERGAARRERRQFPLKLQTSNNLVFPLAHMMEKSPDAVLR